MSCSFVLYRKLGLNKNASRWGRRLVTLKYTCGQLRTCNDKRLLMANKEGYKYYDYQEKFNH